MLVSDPSAVCQLFNNFFTNIGHNTVKNIKQSSDPVSFPCEIIEEFKFSPTSEMEIEEIIKNLNPASANGIDNIPIKFLKKFNSDISKPLLRFITVLNLVSILMYLKFQK